MNGLDIHFMGLAFDEKNQSATPKAPKWPVGAVASRRLGMIHPYLPSGVYERFVARISRAGWVSLVLCWLGFSYSALSRPQHTPPSRRSHPPPPNPDSSQTPSSQRVADPPFTNKTAQADVPRNSAQTDGGAIVKSNFGRQIAAQRSTLGRGSRCSTILVPTSCRQF